MEIAEAKRSIDEMLHTACCYGMGIGTPANLTQTLIYCQGCQMVDLWILWGLAVDPDRLVDLGD